MFRVGDRMMRNRLVLGGVCVWAAVVFCVGFIVCVCVCVRVYVHALAYIV